MFNTLIDLFYSIVQPVQLTQPLIVSIVCIWIFFKRKELKLPNWVTISLIIIIISSIILIIDNLIVLPVLIDNYLFMRYLETYN
jgi:hypothetical protein